MRAEREGGEGLADRACVEAQGRGSAHRRWHAACGAEARPRRVLSRGAWNKETLPVDQVVYVHAGESKTFAGVVDYGGTTCGGAWMSECYRLTVTVGKECTCGDHICELGCGEDGASCPADCPPSCVCGDGECKATCGEHDASCPVDCLAGGDPTKPEPWLKAAYSAMHCPSAHPYWCAASSTCWSESIDCRTQTDCTGDGQLDIACTCGRHPDCTRPVGSQCISW